MKCILNWHEIDMKYICIAYDFHLSLVYINFFGLHWKHILDSYEHFIWNPGGWASGFIVEMSTPIRSLTCTSSGKSLSSRFSMKIPRTRRRSRMYASPLWFSVAVCHVASLVSLRMLSIYRSGFQNLSRSTRFNSWQWKTRGPFY